MPTVSTEFTAPCTQDRAVLAVQDLANSLQWPVLELATSRVVLTGPNFAFSWQFPALSKVTILLKENNSETQIYVTVSLRGPSWAAPSVKAKMTGIMGQIVNGLSVRVQTKSLAINPTVALGEGQGETQNEAPDTDRLAQLERLQKLLESGILTREEFDTEKQKILRGA